MTENGEDPTGHFAARARPNRAILKPHFLVTLLCVAGCSPRMFLAWKCRNGFLADRQEPHSTADIASARMAVVLTGLGVSAQIAVDAAMKALPIFERLFTFEAGELDESLTNIIAVFSSGRSELFAYPRLANYAATDGACVIVDAITIMGHVLDGLDILKPPTVTSPDELKVISDQAVARAWTPESAAGG